MGTRQRGQGRKIAAHGQAIGMAWIGRGAKVPARDKAGSFASRLGRRDLAHHPLEWLGVEPRRSDCEPQELEGAGRIPR